MAYLQAGKRHTVILNILDCDVNQGMSRPRSELSSVTAQCESVLFS